MMFSRYTVLCNFSSQYGNMYYCTFNIACPDWISYFDAIEITAHASAGGMNVVITSFTKTSISGYILNPSNETNFQVILMVAIFGIP